jgi:O-antigen ligase
VSTLLDPNLLAGVLNICLAATFYLWQKKRTPVLSVSCLIIISAIFMTFSRSGYLFLGVQFLLWGLTQYRKALILGILIGLLLMPVVPRFQDRIISLANPDRSALERLTSWHNGLILFQQAPLLGVGFNNLRNEMLENNLHKVYSSDGGHAGSGIDASLIFVLATTGLIGLSAYLYFWWHVLSLKIVDQLLRKTFIVMVIGLFIHSLFVNSLFFPPVLFLIFLWVGTLIWYNDNRK